MAACLMPVSSRRYRMGEEGDERQRWGRREEGGGVNKQRMKADTEKHQLETTAAREADGAWRNMIDRVEGEKSKR